MSNEYEHVESELRAAPRVVPLIRPAKLLLPTGEFVCRVRDISETGISVRLFHDLPLPTLLAIEFQCGARHDVETIWQRGDAVGFRLTGPFDLAIAVSGTGAYPRRPLRLNLQLPVVVSTRERRERATLRNLSTQGAQIEYTALRFAIGELVHIDVPGLPSLQSKVRWRTAETFGTVFEETLTLPELARYAAAVQLSTIPLPLSGAKYDEWLARKLIGQ